MNRKQRRAAMKKQHSSNQLVSRFIDQGVHNYMVFEVCHNHKKCYGCWSGGRLINGEPHLTEGGRAAMLALADLSLGSNDAFIFQELTLYESRSLQSQIIEAIERAPQNSKIIFFGDMSGELDGLMIPAFNLVF